jgi:hypothetical protein
MNCPPAIPSRGYVFLAVLIICLMMPACGGPDLTPLLSSVELRVQDTTCGSADVGWRIWTVSWEETDHGVVPLPWSRTEDYYIADIELLAVRQCDDDGVVTVEIYVDGVLRRTATAQGANATASTQIMID